RLPSEPAPVPVGTGAALGVALWCALAGTGGNPTPQTIARLMGTGSALAGLEALAGQSALADRLATSLAAVRSALRLSVSELADLFGVSRPTIYSWQRGGPSTEDNAVRVQALAHALEPHLAWLEAQPGRVARRAILGQASLLELLRQGHAPD